MNRIFTTTNRILAGAVGLAALVSAPAAQTIDIDTFLTGANAVPPHGSTASGKATVSFDPSTGVLSYDVVLTGMSATLSHIHEAAAGASGPPKVPLTLVGPNHFMGSSVISPAVVSALYSDLLYFNVHSAAFPAGEVRGQLAMPRFSAAPLLNGAMAVPPTATPGTGLGKLSYDAVTKSFEYDVELTNLIGTLTIAHVHNGAPGSSGPPLFPMTIVSPTHLMGTSPPQSDATIGEILRGNSYFNVHTTFAGSGEVRGQARRGFLNTDTPLIGIANGGTQTLDLRAGPSHAGEFYLVLGSGSGTSPGLPAGGFNLPLNFDGYFNFTLVSVGTPPLGGALGLLDGSGAAAITFSLPPGLSAALVGLQLDHAAVGIHAATGAVTFATNAVPLDLL